MYKIKKNFCLGLSKPLNIFDYKIRKIINLSIKNDLYFHISISYHLNFYFVKYLLSKKKRLGIKFISKILGDSMLNFRKSFKLTLNELGIKKLYIAQLVNLPILDPKKRRFDEINFTEFNQLIEETNLLKKTRSIEKLYLQIFSSDDFEFCIKIKKYFDGFAFYADLNNIYIKKEVYDFILENDIPCIILSIFGNPTEKADNDLHIKSYQFSQDRFSSNTIAVGRTKNLNRIEEIITETKNPKNIIVTDNINFNEKKDIQEESINYFNRYKVSNSWYLIIFLLKSIIKLTLPNKIFYYLKKLLKSTK